MSPAIVNSGAPWNPVASTDFLGGDLGQPIPNSNPSSCQQACTLNSSCIGFVVGTRPSGLCSQSACCYLKQALNKPIGSQPTLTAYVNALGKCVD